MEKLFEAEKSMGPLSVKISLWGDVETQWMKLNIEHYNPITGISVFEFREDSPMFQMLTDCENIDDALDKYTNTLWQIVTKKVQFFP